MSEPANPILLDFPASFETARMVIRVPERGEGASMNEAIVESQELLKPWMPFARTVPTVEESEIFTREARLNFFKRTELHMRLYDKVTGDFIGCTGFHNIDWELRNFEAGYWIRSSRAGQGYMTEAVNGLTEYAIRELEANRIEIRCSGRNHKSAAVAERAGFKLDGVLRNARRGLDGELHDTRIYAKVRGLDF